MTETSRFEDLDRAFASGDPASAFDVLAQNCIQERNYSLLFETRMLKKRHAMRLDLLPEGPMNGLTPEQRSEWDAALLEAAKEAGSLYLAAGHLDRAYPYYNAIGDLAPIREALEKIEPSSAGDAAIEVAFGRGVHVRKGFEFILAQHGTCRAITSFDQIQDFGSRKESLRILALTLHRELAANLNRSIDANEGKAAGTDRLAELVAGREYLFGEYDYYIDTSHLISVIRFATETDDEETLRIAVDLCAYGEKLSKMFQHPGEPPLENFFADHARYLRAMLGEDADETIAYFRAKVATYDPYEIGTYPAQVLVRFLLKLKRYQEAVNVSLEFLKDADPQYLSCPTTLQLCRIAGDYDTMMRVAREKDDAISYAAAVLLKK